LITYVSFIVLMLVALSVASTQSLSFIRMIFERLGYAVTTYTFVQLLDLDPINWSQKAMVATLGNINFMSSFLGLTTISYASRLILERQSVSSKIYYFLLTVLNIYLILISQSIQGVGVFLAGISILSAFFVRRKFNFVKSLALLIFTFGFGFLALAGTAGLGPLSRFSQVTVLFRIDYWRAGINMVISNPLNGVGLDSYGDFYREYRTLEATTRTGPQRVTNTAHNIFLDVFAGSGLLSGILMILIMIITGSGLLRSLKVNNPSIDLPAFGGMWIGFIVFCLISINQIGVGIWGFIFTGLLNGFLTRAKMEQGMEVSDKKKTIPIQSRAKVLLDGNSKLSFRENRVLRVSFTSIVSLGMFFLALLPNIADARFLNSIKKSNLSPAIEVIDDFGIQDFHRETLIERLKKGGLEDESLEQALELTRINPQNWSGWIQVITNPRASREQQLEAAKNIRRIDPFNYEAQAEITRALSP
jgi:O-antigen ligase